MNLETDAIIVFRDINKPIKVIAGRLSSSASLFTYANLMMLLIKAVT